MMRMLYQNRGSVSLVLLIVMLPMLAFSGLMIDLANQHLARATAEGAGELALNTALADYDSVLKETYGLFALSQQDPDPRIALNQRLLLHFEAALQTSGLLRSSVQHFEASPVAGSSLANPDVLEQEILSYMKYRGPAEVGLSLLDSLGIFGKFGEQTAVAEKKIEVEHEIADLSVDYAEFYRALVQYDKQVGAYIEAEKNFLLRRAELSNISDLESEAYQEAYSAAEEGLVRLKEESPLEMIAYIVPIGEEIKAAMQGVSKSADEFRDTVLEYREASSNSEGDSFLSAMQAESERYSTQFSPADVDEVLDQIESAKRYLLLRGYESLESCLESDVSSGQRYLSDEAFLKPVGVVSADSGAWMGIPPFYLYLSAAFGESNEENQEHGIGKTLRENIRILNHQAKEKASLEDAFTYAAELFANCPSGTFDAAGSAFHEIQSQDPYGASNQFRTMSVDVRGMFSVLQEGVMNIRDNLLITEYVMSHFSALTSSPEKRTLSGVPIGPEHNRIYGCETEYIIFGGKGCAEEKFLWFTTREAAGPEINLATAKRSIFAVRFVCNSIFALTDASIDQMTLAPAMSIQAASGGVFPYPLAQLTLKLALAMAESSADLERLVEGDKVPLLKTSSTWRCSVAGMIDLLKEKVTEELETIVEQGVDAGIGFLQDCVDGLVNTADLAAEDIVSGISKDLETAMMGKLQTVIGSIVTQVENHAEQAFLRIFSDGTFDRTGWTDTIRLRVTDQMRGQTDELQLLLDPLRKRLEEDVLPDIAQTLEDTARSFTEEGTEVLFEKTLYQAVMGKISGALSTFLKDMSENVTDQVHQMVANAGDDLKSLIAERGEGVTKEVTTRVAQKASDFLDRYVPTVDSSLRLPDVQQAQFNLRDSILCFTYEDYMWLFLLLALCGGQKDEVMLRIADVIQLNVSLSHQQGSLFLMERAYTRLEVIAETKPRSLLLSKGSILGRVKYHGVLGY